MADLIDVEDSATENTAGETGDMGQKATREQSEDGFNLFDRGQLSEEQLSEQLASFMTGGKKPAKGEPKAKAKEAPEESSDSSEESEPDANAEEEVPVETESTEEDSEEGPKQGEEEEESEEGETDESQGWPKSAIRTISEQRQRRREAEKALKERDAELSQLKARLGQADLERPYVGRDKDPLEFATTPDQLRSWEDGARKFISLAEDHAEGLLDEEGQELLEAWAKKNKAFSNGEIDAAALRRARREAQSALLTQLPARREWLVKQQEYNKKVDADPVFQFLKDPNSPDYQNAVAILKEFPEIKRLPHWKFALGIYALGMRAYKAGAKKPAAPAGKPLPKGAKTVNTPGKAVTVPRNVKATPQQSAAARVRKADASEEDFVDYARAALGHIGE